jgi:menaquinone-dependent protoporphyrinogen oxidase
MIVWVVFARVFAGKLDHASLSLDHASLSRVERLMVRAQRAPVGDFRDWDAIRAWARGVGGELSELRAAG